MKGYAIIKKGTKDDPIWMHHAPVFGRFRIIEEKDNLPVFQPYPDFINKEELDKLGGEIVEVEYNIVGK